MDSIRIVAPPGCKAVHVNGRPYPVTDGAAVFTDPKAWQLRPYVDALPGQMWGGTGAGAALVCDDCGRMKPRLASRRCPECGGTCR